MPIYPYSCVECGKRFEILSRTFEVGEVSCPQCKSLNTKRQMSIPVVRVGRSREPGSESAARDAAIEYHADKGDFSSAAREAERVGMNDAEVRSIGQGFDWRD
ncbi:MAG: zinc ribbon domain-containing protein [Chloroflexi bacterium]|nr:zinc ribbon domain-containing protein [Chloroflexota bacterium]